MCHGALSVLKVEVAHPQIVIVNCVLLTPGGHQQPYKGVPLRSRVTFFGRSVIISHSLL